MRTDSYCKGALCLLCEGSRGRGLGNKWGDQLGNNSNNLG